MDKYYAPSNLFKTCNITDCSTQCDAIEQEHDSSSWSKSDENNLVHLLEESTDEQNISTKAFLKFFVESSIRNKKIFFTSKNNQSKHDLSGKENMANIQITYFLDKKF